MTYEFRYECTRRPARALSVIEYAVVRRREPLGAGSGGDGDCVDYKEGAAGIHAEVVLITAMGGHRRFHQVSPLISVVAGDIDPSGRLEMHGSAGVRITSGPPNLPKASNPDINGVQIQVGDSQQIKIQRGMPGSDNEIQLNPDLLVVDGKNGEVFITSDTKIKLQVANGMSSITLGPDGVTINGLLTQINPYNP